MFKYALLDYVPQRYLRRASFDTLENDRFILDFKSGRRYATDKASRLIGKALSLMNLKDTVIVCIPAYKNKTLPEHRFTDIRVALYCESKNLLRLYRRNVRITIL